jgi:hypothetical protein
MQKISNMTANLRELLARSTLLFCLVVPLSAVAVEPGFRPLFNGANLDGWDGDPRFWRVENGEIVGQTTESNKAEQNTFLIFRKGEFADFELHLKYQVQGYNSGVQYRSVDLGKWVVSGYQCDFEDRWHKADGGPIDRFSGMFFDEKGRMFLGQRGEAVIVRHNADNSKKPLIEKFATLGDPVELERAIRRDDWNECRVIAGGFQFTHIINGRVMALGIDEDAPNRRAAGIIAFQLHSGPPMKLRIKDIEIREIGTGAAK